MTVSYTHLTLVQIAEATGIPHNFVCTGMTRLKKLGLATNQYNPKSGARWILINPSILWSGSDKRTSILEKEWENAMRKDDITEVKRQLEDEELHERITAHNLSIDRRNSYKLEGRSVQ